MKVYFSLLCDKWRIRMLKNVTECWLKCKNRYWIRFTRKWSFFSLMNVTSRNCSPLHANDAYFLVMISKRCTCPCLLFNSLLAFWLSPEGIPKTLAFWVRGYLKRGDTQNAATKLFIRAQKRKEFGESKPKYRTIENKTLIRWFNI